MTADFNYEYRYPLDEYMTTKGDPKEQQQFHVSIGPNTFSRTAMSLHLESKYIHSIQPTDYVNHSAPIVMELSFGAMAPGFPLSLFQLGAMGYYGWIPILECYHGILSMNFEVRGRVDIADRSVYQFDIEDVGGDGVSVSDGKQVAHGYLEKDWGTNFPTTWIWIQANHFEADSTVSMTIALARLPVLGDSWLTKPGFLSGIYINGKVYALSYPMWSTVETLDIVDDEQWRTITIQVSSFWRTQRLEVVATVPNAYSLDRKEAIKRYPHALVPDEVGVMSPRLMEFVNATAWMRFVDDDNDVVFESTSYPATVECHGEDDMQYMLQNFGI